MKDAERCIESRRSAAVESCCAQVDDDQIYGHRLLEKLLTTTGPVPGRAIGAATQHAYNYLHGPVLEGVHGVLFQRKFFDRWASNYEGRWGGARCFL